MDKIFLVEDYMDGISLNKRGIENCVDNSVKALTERQNAIHIQCINEMVTCCDRDESG